MIRRGYLRYGTPGAWQTPSPTVAAWIDRIFDGRKPARRVDGLFAALKGER